MSLLVTDGKRSTNYIIDFSEQLSFLNSIKIQRNQEWAGVAMWLHQVVAGLLLVLPHQTSTYVTNNHAFHKQMHQRIFVCFKDLQSV